MVLKRVLNRSVCDNSITDHKILLSKTNILWLVILLSQAEQPEAAVFVTMTCKVNGKMEILTCSRSETPKSIETKIGVNGPLQPCQFLWKSVQQGLFPYC